jgi:hypothetical protein
MTARKRVAVTRDTCSPLWVIRCAQPCQPAGWCMNGPEGKHPPHCWLLGSMTEEGARSSAARLGYEVQA